MNGSFKKEWNPHISPSAWQQGHHVPDARGTHLYTAVCDMGAHATCDSSERDLSDSPWGTTQASRCVSALTCDIHHPHDHTPFPRQAVL